MMSSPAVTRKRQNLKGKGLIPAYFSTERRFPFEKESGLAVLGIIFGLLVFGTLVLAVLNMSSTSQMKVVSTNMALKAYYLAESGFRIAAGYYLNTGEDDSNIDAEKAEMLKDQLNQQTFQVGGKGNVTLNIFPYWMITTQGIGSPRSAQFPGSVAADLDIPDAGHLFYMDSSDPSNNLAFSYNSGSLNTGTGVFSYSVSGSPASFAEGESLYFYLQPVASTTIRHGTDLQLAMFDDYSEDIFPRHQGNIQIIRASADPEHYIYSHAEYDSTTDRLTLQNLKLVTDPDNRDNWTKAIAHDDKIVFKKFALLESHGRAGEEERMLRFHTPIQDSLPTPDDDIFVPETKAEWAETFAVTPSVDDWDVRALYSSGGGQDVYAEMKTVGTTSGSGNDYKHGTFWYKNRGKVHDFWNLGGKRLSYDVQTKPGTGNELPHLAAGISVRARGTTLNDPDSYLGVSFMRYALPTVYFVSAGQIGGRDIAPGDRLEYGWEPGQSGNWQTKGRGVVQGNPVVTSGSFADGNAQGWLRLANNATGSWASPPPFTGELKVGNSLFGNLRNTNGYVAPPSTDYIPDAIKPIPADFSPARYEIGPLLLVIWERNDDSWNWLAYKDISEDAYVRGFQDWPGPHGDCSGSCPGNDGQVINDKACLLVRVREKSDTFIDSLEKFNEINVFYGDASERWTSGRSGNNISYDIMSNRKQYLSGGNPSATYFPTWPPQRLTLWNQPIDFFSHLEEPSLSGSSLPEFQWDAINPGKADSVLILDDGTIRTTILPTPDNATDYREHEIGLHAFGNIVQDPFGSIAFADFALRFVFEDAKLYGGFLEPYVQ